MSFTVRLEPGNERHFDVVASNEDGVEVGKLEGDYVADGPSYIDRFWIGNCYVHPDWRRRGIGSEMVMVALDEAAQRYTKATHAFADASAYDGTVTSDEVLGFWKAHGFGEVPNAQSIGRALYGQLLMRPLRAALA